MPNVRVITFAIFLSPDSRRRSGRCGPPHYAHALNKPTILLAQRDKELLSIFGVIASSFTIIPSAGNRWLRRRCVSICARFCRRFEAGLPPLGGQHDQPQADG